MPRHSTFITFLKGLTVGAAATAAVLGTYAFASQSPRRATSEERAGECAVDVGFGSATFSDQCRTDKVMVGVRDGYILCAPVTVTCPEPRAPSPEL